MFLKTLLVILAFGAESRVLGLECYHTDPGPKTQEELVFEQKDCNREKRCFGVWSTESGISGLEKTAPSVS